MPFWDELLASRKVGYRAEELNRAGWEVIGIDETLKQKDTIKRYNLSFQFVLDSVQMEDLKRAHILDVGEYNPFSRWIKDQYGISVENTPPDLDFDEVDLNEDMIGTFDYLFAFEIIEHLMNPLLFLKFLRKHLKEKGKLFLSTPFVRPRLLWSKYHFVEYFPDKIEWLAHKVGFQVARYEARRVFPYWYAFQGIRPFLRAIWFSKLMLFEFVNQKQE